MNGTTRPAVSPVANSAGLLLRVLRLSSQLEQERMASRLKISQPTVSRWEKGRAGPDERQLAAWLLLCQSARHGAGLPALPPAWFNAAVKALRLAYLDGPPASEVEAQALSVSLRRLGLELLSGTGRPSAGPGSRGNRGQPAAFTLHPSPFTLHP